MSIECAVDKSFVIFLYIFLITEGPLRLRHQLAAFDFCSDRLKGLLWIVVFATLLKSIIDHLSLAPLKIAKESIS